MNTMDAISFFFSSEEISCRSMMLLKILKTSHTLSSKGETITHVNGDVSFFAGKRLQNF